MSSAANHRARSRRSYARHASAMRGEQRYTIKQARNSAGMDGAPLIYRMQAMFRRAREARQKRNAEEGGAEG